MTSPPVPPQAITAAAAFLHDDECNDGDTRTCGRWRAGSDPASRFHSLHARHVEFYRDKAAGVLKAAEPHLAAAVPTGIIHIEGGKLSEADVAELAERWKAAWRDGEYAPLPDNTDKRIAEAVAAERERCAQLAEAEAAKLSALGESWAAISAGALEDLASLLRQGGEGGGT